MSAAVRVATDLVISRHTCAHAQPCVPQPRPTFARPRPLAAQAPPTAPPPPRCPPRQQHASPPRGSRGHQHTRLRPRLHRFGGGCGYFDRITPRSAAPSAYGYSIAPAAPVTSRSERPSSTTHVASSCCVRLGGICFRLWRGCELRVRRHAKRFKGKFRRERSSGGAPCTLALSFLFEPAGVTPNGIFSIVFNLLFCYRPLFTRMLRSFGDRHAATC